MNTDKATPRPWTYFKGNSNGKGLIRIESSCEARPSGIHITSLTRSEQSEDNAALIVRAVNAHESLIAALTRMIITSGLDPNDDRRLNAIEKAETALKLAKGE